MYELPIIHAWESAYAAPRGGAGARGTPANEQTKAESAQTGPCTTPTTPPGGGKPNSQFQKVPGMTEIADCNLARKTKICYNASNAGAGNGCGGWARYTHSQERRVAARRSASRFFSPERRSLEEAGWEGRAAGHGNSPFQLKYALKNRAGAPKAPARNYPRVNNGNQTPRLQKTGKAVILKGNRGAGKPAVIEWAWYTLCGDSELPLDCPAMVFLLLFFCAAACQQA